jgi:hypothetical protein
MEEKVVLHLQPFFEKQAPFLESIDIYDMGNVDWFDPMRLLLRNLETVKFGSWNKYLNLNALNILPRLKCLDVSVTMIGFDECYRLGVCELISLTELRISCCSRVKISSQHTPMLKIESFMLSCAQLSLEVLEQLPQIMPRLKKLDIKMTVRKP